MSYSLGIDFGTSTTKVALRQENAIPQPLPIGKGGEFFMPSVVAYKRTKNDMAETVAIAEDAAVVPETEDTHVINEIKRCLTAAGSSVKLPQERYPWWNHEDACIELWSSRFSPHDVVLAILNEAVERAVRLARELGFGAEVDRFTIRGLPMRIGVSVKASLETRKVLAEVARRLGFPTFRVESLCEEPILACLSYVHLEPEITPGETILVYDLGGGTFDTAIVKLHEDTSREVPSLTVFAADGEPFMGGVDIDERLFQHLSRRIAEEELGFEQEEQTQILSLMNADEKQKLWNQAREAKEALSTVDETRIVLPPGFLGEAEIALTISRSELETIVKDTRLIERTLECVLRNWRRARMLLRKQGEAVATFNLHYDKSSGRVAGSVFKLNHQDLNAFVDRILVVGGTARMPVVRRTLTSLWGENKFMSEDVVRPIEACSMGAAWQQESVNAIVDRLPFSINVSWESGGSSLYQAFAPTVAYKTLTATPSISSFRSDSISLPSGCKEVSIVLETPDGETKTLIQNLPAGPYTLEIDVFGRCVVKDGLGRPYELANPAQHPLQKALWDVLEQEKQREEEENKKRTTKYLFRKPGEDLREVG